MSAFLDRLQHVMQTSHDSWSAQCPVCEDPGLTLTVLRNTKGNFDLFCLNDCDKDAILESAGIMWASLYPRDEPIVRHVPIRPGAGVDLEVERAVVDLGTKALEQGHELSLFDLARLQIARRRTGG